MIKLKKFSISYERGRQLLLFLFCLFLAFIIWSIHKLSEEYTVYLQYKVSVASDLASRAAEAHAGETLIVRGRSGSMLREDSSKNLKVFMTGSSFLLQISGIKLFSIWVKM